MPYLITSSVKTTDHEMTPGNVLGSSKLWAKSQRFYFYDMIVTKSSHSSNVQLKTIFMPMPALTTPKRVGRAATVVKAQNASFGLCS